MNSNIGKRLTEVLKKIEDAYVSVAIKEHMPRLVAVSKEKPIGDILEAYKFGHRHFGENRIQSLIDKSQQLKESCPEIQWHYIGRLQSNKIKHLARVNNLFLVETVDTIDHARALNELRSSYPGDPLMVMLQVNTSGEDQKGGVTPTKLSDLYHDVVSSCTHLVIIGLMCIGKLRRDSMYSSNPDFAELVRCRNSLSLELGIPANSLELSMGMSHDFEEAIRLGSTNVRVGTTIFGERSQ